MDILRMEDWGLGLTTDRPIIISGPCSAESEEQVMKSCLGVAEHGAHILRAGIWKPRTRPNSFEGLGSEALPWIKAAGKATGLPVTVEVANAKHVYEALRNHIDILWIGARTTVNPFAVQEIADALRGVNIPVMIKNPINPDVALWMGAFERMHKAGIKKLAAIHRGFSVTNSKPYRNLPMWDKAIELRRKMPEIEIINDPSHISGNRELLLPVSQKALDLNFDGLMIESHITPEIALSDAAQQVTPVDFGKLVGSLVKRSTNSSDPLFTANLEALRADIDMLDHEIIKMFSKRMEVAKEIAKYKKANDVQILQMNRWKEIRKDRIDNAVAGGLTENFASKLLQLVHDESIEQQELIMTSMDKEEAK